MNTTNPSITDSGDWTSCQGGEVDALVTTLRGRRRRAAVRRWTGVLVVGMVLVGGGWVTQRAMRGTLEEVAELSCREVRMQLASYQDGSVPGQLLQQIERHLGRCKSCHQYMHHKEGAPAAKPSPEQSHDAFRRRRFRDDMVIALR